MKKSFLLLLSLGLMTSCFAGPKPMSLSKADQVDSHMKMGIGFMESENYPKALQEFLRASELDTQNPVIFNNLGIVYYYRENFLEAEKNFVRALELLPEYTDARNNLGRIYLEIGRVKIAIDELNKAAQDLTYNMPEKVQINLGYAYTQLGEYTRALKHFEKATSLKRDSCEAHKQVGITLYQLEKFSQTVHALDLAQKICKIEQADIFYFRALSYYRLNRSDRAVLGLQELISRFPQSPLVSKARNHLRIIK